MIFAFLWLTSLSMTVSRSIHVAASGVTLFILWLSNIPLCIQTASYPFFCWWPFRCLRVLVLVNRATALLFDTALSGSKSWLSEIWANSPVNASQNHRLLETEGTWRIREASRRQGGMFWDSEVTLLRSLAALWEFFFRQHSKLLWGVLRWCLW